MDVLFKSINICDLLPSHDLDDTSPLSAPDLRILIDRLNLHSLHIKPKVQNYIVSHNQEFLTLFQQCSDSVTNSQHLSVKVADLVDRLDDNEIENVERIVDEIRVRRGEMKEKKDMLDLVDVVVKMSQVLSGIECHLGSGKFVEAAEAVSEMKSALRVSDGAVEVMEPVVFGLLRKKLTDSFEKIQEVLVKFIENAVRFDQQSNAVYVKNKMDVSSLKW